MFPKNRLRERNRPSRQLYSSLRVVLVEGEVRLIEEKLRKLQTGCGSCCLVDRPSLCKRTLCSFEVSLLETLNA